MTNTVVQFNELPEQRCPVCGLEIDASVAANPKAGVRPNAVGICVECTSFLRLDIHHKVRVLTDEEIGNLDDQTRMGLQHARLLLQGLDE